MSYEGQNTTICWKKQLVSGPALYFLYLKKSKETLKIEGRQLLAQSINAYGEEEQWALIQ